MHCTSGRVSSSRGFLVPQPPDGIELSTGTLRGPLLLGVCVPGVPGGVKAGERREGGGGRVSVGVPAFADGGSAKSST